MSIVVIGASFVDIKGFPEGSYLPTGRNAGFVEYVHGGVSRNVAEDIAQLNLPVIFVSLVDDTGMGQSVIDHLNESGVDTTYVKKIKQGMGTWLAVFDEQGDVAGSISQRPILDPLLDTLEKYGDALFKEADSIVIEVDIDERIVKKAIALAKKYNKKIFGVVANMSIAHNVKDLIYSCECFVCNEQEAEILFDATYQNKQEEEILNNIEMHFKDIPLSSLVVTRGEKGSVYISNTGEKGFYESQAVDVVDTTGAGDSFFAGVVSGLTIDKSLKDSVKIGTTLACDVICKPSNICKKMDINDIV